MADILRNLQKTYKYLQAYEKKKDPWFFKEAMGYLKQAMEEDTDGEFGVFRGVVAFNGEPVETDLDGQKGLINYLPESIEALNRVLNGVRAQYERKPQYDQPIILMGKEIRQVFIDEDVLVALASGMDEFNRYGPGGIYLSTVDAKKAVRLALKEES